MAADRKISSGQDLEDTLKGFMTQGALNPGSGFDRKWGVGKSEGEVLDRLEAWKRSKGITSSTGSPAAAPRPPAAAPKSAVPTTTSTAPSIPSQVGDPLAGLTAISPDTTKTDMPMLPTGEASGAMGIGPEMEPMTGVASEALGHLRALGRRTPPINTASFAALKRIY